MPDDNIVPIIQGAVGGVIALASLFVSVASFRLTREDKLGREPIITVSDWSWDSGRYRQGENRFLFTLDIWNRRRFAVCINRVVIDFSSVTPASLDSERSEEGWNIEGKRLSLYGRFVVKANDNITISETLILKKPGWKSPFAEDIDLRADFFDPLTAKPSSIHGVYRIRDPVENTRIA